MTTLAASLSATDRVLRTVAALGIEANYPIPVLVGSECLIATRQMAKAGYQYQVLRGQNGTAPASHVSGASVTAYSGGGSGGVTVDNGSDPPAAVTTLVAPGANLSTPGEATLIYLQVRAFDVDTDTPNLINPGDGAGAVAFAVPAGSYGYAFPLVTALWNQAATLEISLGTSPSVHGRIGDWDLTASNAETYAAIEAVTVSPVGQTFLGRWFKAIEDCEIYVAVYPDAGDPTAGSATITAIIATPAS